MKILLVDDEKELVSTLAERLGYRGIEAHWAAAPDDALAMLSDQRYDIAVLDVQMPQMNGFELKRHMEAKSPELKFIFMTGHGCEESYHIGSSETGEAFYLVKPVEIKSLIETLNLAMLDGGDS